MRYGDVCPGSAEATGAPDASGGHGSSVELCVSLYAHEYTPQRTRVYLRAHFESGISPLPAPPSPAAPEG